MRDSSSIGDHLVYTITNSIKPVTAEKFVDKDIAGLNDVITYSVNIENPNKGSLSGVIFKDTIPQGTYLVGGINGMAKVSFQVQVGDIKPDQTPIQNSATVTVPTKPELITNTVETKINDAKLVIKKVARENIQYDLEVTDNGNINAEKVIIKDTLPTGVEYKEGSLEPGADVSGDPINEIILTNPIEPGKTVLLRFKVKVIDIANPNPISNIATAEFKFTPDLVKQTVLDGKVKSNKVITFVPLNNFGQQISDIIGSVALEQAALAVIEDAEGAKIQAMSSRIYLTVK